MDMYTGVNLALLTCFILAEVTVAEVFAVALRGLTKIMQKQHVPDGVRFPEMGVPLNHPF
jgi:hypothetical protein